MLRRTLALTGLLTVAFALVRAEQPAKKADKADDPTKTSADVRDKTLLEQRILASRFADFKAAVLRVKQRLEKGTAEDKDKARALQNALDEIDKQHLDTEFSRLVKLLNDKSLTNVGDAQEAVQLSKKLAAEMQAIITMLREDNRAARLREERKRLEEMIRELEGIIRDQSTVRAKTAMPRMDKDDLANGQKRVSDRTAELHKKLGGKEKGRGGEGKPADKRSGTKGKGKGGAKAGEGKDKGPNHGDNKKKGDQGGKAGDKNKGKGGDKAGGEKGQGKGGDKAAGQKGQGNQGGAKPQPKQPGQGKSPGKGEGSGKGQGKGQSGQGKGQGGKGGSKGSKGGSKGGGQQGGKSGGQSGKPNDQKPQNQEDQADTTDSRKKIQEGRQYQGEAEKDLEKDDKKKAGNDQDEAIKKLKEAKKKLEELLRQTREEELERLLNALENRCRQMLEMQRAVKAGTVELDKVIQANKDHKPTRTNQQDSGRLADKEKDIVLEANKAIEMIEAEGSAVAFAEVFKQVRTDMQEVQRLLELTQVASLTQSIEQDIIESLEDMIKALQKAKAELGQGGSGGGPPPDQKLLDMIAELKMIRAMQVKVNRRTKVYAREYVAREGEQTANPMIKDKLKDLSERQEKLFDVTMKIVKGDNR